MNQKLRDGTLYQLVEVDNWQRMIAAGKFVLLVRQNVKIPGYRSVYTIGRSGADRDVRFREARWVGLDHIRVSYWHTASFRG